LLAVDEQGNVKPSQLTGELTKDKSLRKFTCFLTHKILNFMRFLKELNEFIVRK